MDLLRVAGATLNQTPLDFIGNQARIMTLLEEARLNGVELLCLPELCITGYGCEDAFFSLSTARKAEDVLSELLPATAGLTVVLGLPHFFSGAMYNCAVVVQDGRVLGVNAKRVLPREGVHYEPRWFKPWPFGQVSETRLCGQRVPLGDLRYRLGTVGVAIEICEEAWDGVPAAAAHADAVDIILNPSASHFALGKYVRREHLVANSSRSMHVIYVYTNLLGLEAGRLIYDGGVLVAEDGDIVTRGTRFGFVDGGIVYRDVNPEMARTAKLKAKPVRGESVSGVSSCRAAVSPDGEIVGADPRHLTVQATVTQTAHAAAKAPGKSNAGAAAGQRLLTRNEEFLAAEMLGLFDYLRKASARGYVLSLSGGVDSATCATLVGHMVATAMTELGADSFARRLGLAFSAGDLTPRAVVGRLLTCVYQATANSGEVTRAAASAVAEALGADYHETDVEPMVQGYKAAVEGMIGRSFSWERDDIALQNVQARARAPLVWLLANVKGALLLTTSNRSEAAVGYATMDGDTAGGLAPLAGIDKPFLRQWLTWAETACLGGLGPLPALGAVNVQAPTAELRPQGAAQKDEEDLMPYQVLERIERYLIRDRLGPEDILESLEADFPDQSRVSLRAHLEKFFRLWAASQWKRERLAPSFHVDDENLDPRTWCRFPILSRPYTVEG